MASTLTALAAYTAVALFIYAVWTGALRRMIPSWLLICVWGSILYTVIDLTPGVINGWNDPHRMEPSLIEYLSTELSSARSVMFVLTVLTLPATAVMYYVVDIRDALRRWHEGADKPPTILSDETRNE